MDCPYFHGNKDRRYLDETNYREAMQPRQRNQMEQLVPITHTNLVISNVNHLKELLFNLRLESLTFMQLAAAFRDY